VWQYVFLNLFKSEGALKSAGLCEAKIRVDPCNPCSKKMLSSFFLVLLNLMEIK